MPKQVRLVDNGFVYCLPRRKDVDIEECFGCQKLSRLDLDSRHPYIVCEVSSPLDLSPVVSV